MLASRTLPPIYPRSPPSPPLAIFRSIPRRYVKSNMRAGEHASPRTEKIQSSRQLRKDSKAIDTSTESTLSPVRRTSEFHGPIYAPSSPRLTRKRAAPFEEDVEGLIFDDEGSPTDIRAPQSASSTGSGELLGHVCLCQPEPKIPRPRNAFILYRQHHQHNIVARNPGLANPEISKIIGEQWQAESEDQKKVWQDLAQEEKAKHQEQYPDYRYQPRRLGKSGSLSSNPANQHMTVDKYRCPKCGGRSIRTPTSPFPGTLTPTLPPPTPSENLTPISRYPSVMTSNLSLESPAYRRHAPGPSNLSNIQVPSSPHGNMAMHSPLTPDLKRRRYNYSGISNGRQIEDSYYGHHRRESLPPISQMRPSPPNTATLPTHPRTPREIWRPSVDLNVLVPNQHDQSRSVEAMVMSVPYPVKIKVLGRITPPLKDPGPTSPAVQVRGGIVAVEGDDMAAVKELTEWLEDYLNKEKEYSPRIADPPKGPEEGKKEVTFEDYLDLIKEWHGKSQEMIKYITTPVTTSDSDSDRGNKPASSTAEAQTKPVIILPTYQLRASDGYTSRIPIQDAYSPTDHWQWMATLWRGTIGPDLTIYIAGTEEKERSPGKLVELNEEVRLLTVRKDKGSKFDEAALRRVGFEVGEWIRSVGTKSV